MMAIISASLLFLPTITRCCPLNVGGIYVIAWTMPVKPCDESQRHNKGVHSQLTPPIALRGVDSPDPRFAGKLSALFLELVRPPGDSHLGFLVVFYLIIKRLRL